MFGFSKQFFLRILAKGVVAMCEEILHYPNGFKIPQQINKINYIGEVRDCKTILKTTQLINSQN